MQDTALGSVFLEYKGLTRCVCGGGGYPCGKEVECNLNIYTQS